MTPEGRASPRGTPAPVVAGLDCGRILSGLCPGRKPPPSPASGPADVAAIRSTSSRKGPSRPSSTISPMPSIAAGSSAATRPVTARPLTIGTNSANGTKTCSHDSGADAAAPAGSTSRVVPNSPR